MSARTLPHVLSALYNAPLMVSPRKLETVLAAIPSILSARGEVRIVRMDSEDDEDRPRRPTYGYRIKDGVATVPVHGVLVRRAGQISPDSEPLQSYENLSRVIASAVSDQRVRGLLLDVDSPGGESGQALQLAADIRRQSQVKPIWAVANDDALSAAYGLAAGAARLWITPTSSVGSIGTLAVHTDRTAADAAEGVKYTFVHAGQRKIDFTSHRPLAATARDRLQAEVDRQQAMFVDSVAGHRGISSEGVIGTQAGLFFGPEAISAGLADQIGTPAEAHAALAAYVTPQRTRSSAMSAQQNAQDQKPEQERDPPPADQPQGQPPKPAGQPQPQPAPEQPKPAPQPQGQPQQQPQPEQPQTAASAIDVTNVVTMARESQRDRDVEIVAACQLASRGDLADMLLRSDMTAEQARRYLLTQNAEQSAAHRVVPSSAHAGANTGGPTMPPPIKAEEAYRTHRKGD